MLVRLIVVGNETNLLLICIAPVLLPHVSAFFRPREEKLEIRVSLEVISAS
jgi:hypothetical protein